MQRRREAAQHSCERRAGPDGWLGVEEDTFDPSDAGSGVSDGFAGLP